MLLQPAGCCARTSYANQEGIRHQEREQVGCPNFHLFLVNPVRWEPQFQKPDVREGRFDYLLQLVSFLVVSWVVQEVDQPETGGRVARNENRGGTHAPASPTRSVHTPVMST